MGFRVAVALCLSLALVANGQVLSDLAAKENQLNCLLGKPDCLSPPPPPTTTTPPPATPPEATPPTPSEAPTPSPSEGPTPSEAPTPAPGPIVPVPAPGPIAAGTALAVVSLSFPDGFPVTDAIRSQLVALIQAKLGSSATVELQVSGGRKMLEITTFTLVLADVTTCVGVGFTLEVYIPGRFITDAQGESIPLQSASLTVFSCTYPGEAPYTISGSPATSPGSVPASGPGSSGPGSSITPGSGPAGSTPGSSPITAPGPAPVPAPVAGR